MAAFKIKKGLDIPLSGEANKTLKTAPSPARVGIMPRDFSLVKFQLRVEEGQDVKVGTPLLQSKADPEIVLVSTVAGKVDEIRRGDRRALLAVSVRVDNTDDAENFGAKTRADIESMDTETLASHLKKGGVWPLIRQRPFDKLAESKQLPKSIFVNAMATAPLAADTGLLLDRKKTELQAGFDALLRFAPGKVHLVTKDGDSSEVFQNLEGVQSHRFSGPHPSGLSSTHIHHIDPINKGETVWVLSAPEAALIGEFLLTGKTPTHTVAAVAGDKASNSAYYKVLRGAELASFVECNADARIISGDVLTGQKSEASDFLGYADHLVSVIPEGGKQHYLGSDQHWGSAGFGRYTASKLYASRLLGWKTWNLDTLRNGDERAIILQDVYDRYVPLDIFVTFLTKACVAGDIEEMEKLGIYEIEPEDVALCTFACPSKTEVSEIIRSAQALIEKEG